MSEERHVTPADDKLVSYDPIWRTLRDQAEQLAGTEPALASFVHATILRHERLEAALASPLARPIGGEN